MKYAIWREGKLWYPSGRHAPLGETDERNTQWALDHGFKVLRWIPLALSSGWNLVSADGYLLAPNVPADHLETKERELRAQEEGAPTPDPELDAFDGPILSPFAQDFEITPQGVEMDAASNAFTQWIKSLPREPLCFVRSMAGEFYARGFSSDRYLPAKLDIRDVLLEKGDRWVVQQIEAHHPQSAFVQWEFSKYELSIGRYCFDGASVEELHEHWMKHLRGEGDWISEIEQEQEQHNPERKTMITEDKTEAETPIVPSTKDMLLESLKNSALVSAAGEAERVALDQIKALMGEAYPEFAKHPMAEEFIKTLTPLIVHYLATNYGEAIPGSKHVALACKYATDANLTRNMTALLQYGLPIIAAYAKMGAQLATAQASGNVFMLAEALPDAATEVKSRTAASEKAVR